MNTDDIVAFLGRKGELLGFSRQGVQYSLLPADESTEIRGVTHDSRKVKKGSLFVCLRGVKSDGHDFTADARKRGASAILSEKPTDSDLLHIMVKDTRKILGYTASEIYGRPSGSLKMIAVTGTNGKSTTAFMIRSIFGQSGIRQGLLGTIVYDDGSGMERDADRTTPEATDIQESLSEMLKNGYGSCVMEASSHGLSQGRLSGCSFDAAVFTNLTPEHLDFHGSMENYFEAKVRLFKEHMRGRSWIGSANADDPYGRRVKALFPENVSSFGLSTSVHADYSARIKNMDLSGIGMEIILPGKGSVIEVKLPLAGFFNAQNALGAAVVSLEMGLDPEDVKQGLEEMPQVPGRLQMISLNTGVTVLIDYAHTPDALQSVLEAVREVCKGKIWSVFGLGGDRFKENRPIMGEIASKMADHVVVTMDNPRSEDPQKIAEQIISGFRITDYGNEKADWRIILDRKNAVNHALDSAMRGDAVLVSGKGPEKNIIFSDRSIPYSDIEAVKEWCRSRGVSYK